MNKPVELFNDQREIESLWFEPLDGAEYSIIRVSPQSGVTRIEAYAENGQAAPVPWFAVWKDNQLIQRVNAAYVAGVNYKEAPR